MAAFDPSTEAVPRSSSSVLVSRSNERVGWWRAERSISGICAAERPNGNELRKARDRDHPERGSTRWLADRWSAGVRGQSPPWCEKRDDQPDSIESFSSARTVSEGVERR